MSRDCQTTTASKVAISYIGVVLKSTPCAKEAEGWPIIA